MNSTYKELHPPELTQTKIKQYRSLFNLLFWVLFACLHLCYFEFVSVVPFIPKTCATYLVLTEGYIILCYIFYLELSEFKKKFSKLNQSQCEDLVLLSKRNPSIEFYRLSVLKQKRDFLSIDYQICVKFLMNSKNELAL